MGEKFGEFMNPPIELECEKEIGKQIINIGINLRELRKKNSLSGREVCQKLKDEYGLDIQENTLVSYESEKRVPNVKIFLALCELYKCVDVMEYFCGNTSEKTSISLENYDTKGIANILVQHYGENGIKEIIGYLLEHMKLK